MNLFYKVTFSVCFCFLITSALSGCNHSVKSKDEQTTIPVPEQIDELPNEKNILGENEDISSKILTIDEYSLGIYPYYKNVITSYSVKTINKDMVVDGKSVIMKNVIKLTVGFTNNDELPIAYLWSPKPPISVDISDTTDISGYPQNVGENHNVMFLMPGESIVYDFFLKPTDINRVIYQGKSSITFLPISEPSIVDNPNYDLNNIFVPPLGAKNYSNYMVHSSNEFEMNIDTGEVKFVEKEDIASSIDAIRHEYYSVESSVMDSIRKNGYSFYNVTPAYTLRYDLSSEKGMVNFLDDIDANIPITNNLQHSKNQYYALSEGKSVIYVPDINKLTTVADDNGKCYDLSLESFPSTSILEHSQLNLQETIARLVCVDGYINFILLSDENYEYIKPLASYPQFGISSNQLYTPIELAKNLKLNFSKIQSAKSSTLAEGLKLTIVEKVNEVFKLYNKDEVDIKNFAVAPENIDFSSTVDEADVSLDISDESGRAIASVPLYNDDDELYTMIVIFTNYEDKPKVEATAFIKGQNSGDDDGIPIYNKKKLLESINNTAKRYTDHDYDSKYFDALPPNTSFNKIKSLEGVKVVIDYNDITRATVTLPINKKKNFYAQLRIRDITGQCKVVGVKFISQQDTEK